MPVLEFKSRLLCVGGMHGHGHYALRSLIDGHPQVVAYPFFLANFFRYWRHGVFNGLHGAKLVNIVWPVVSDDPIFSANIGSSKDSIGFRDEFVKSVFEKKILLLGARSNISLQEVLYCLIDAFKESLENYRSTEALYYAFEVDAREFPWEDNYFLTEVTHLFTYRDFNRSYTSHRADFLERHSWSLPYFLFARGTLETSQLLYIWKKLKSNLNNSRMVLFPFERMRDESEKVMIEISQKLGLTFNSSLLYLTRIGVPENGFTTDGHKTNRISAKGGNYFLPITNSELSVNYMCKPVDPWTQEPVILNNTIGIFGFIAMAWKEAFTQLPDIAITNDVSGKFVSDFETFEFFSRHELVSYFKKKKINLADGYKLAAGVAHAGILKSLILRTGTFLGFLAVYATGRWFGGDWVLWPHLVLLIRLNLYHSIEKRYKVKANMKMVSNGSV